MNINQIYPILINKNKQQDKYNLINTFPSFQARVDKGMARFYEVNVNRMPHTVRTYIESLKDKFSISPLDAQKKSFEKLQDASNVDEVKKLFPNEELFKNLISDVETRATKGILAIIREFRELYSNILKNGEDLSIYLLKKIFMEAETIDEINLDLEQDLNKDIVNVFKFRHGDSDFILSSTLRALGISTPDIAYQNSLRFTREGYSDEFGSKISEAQLRYWNSLSDEQKFELLTKRLEGRDNWWNSLSYQEKLEYAAGMESQDECFHNYKKYVSNQKRKKTYGNIREDGSSLNRVKLTKRKISVGSKLQHKDIFGLWMKKNLEKFYNGLSEADKDSVHMIRVRRLAIRWQSMSTEEKTALINKMKEGREPLRYAMIDAWNHSHNIIKELSKFLKEKQILKPVEMLYSSEGFSEFQSAVMTEFWDTHPEFAIQLGENIKTAYERVNDAINRGQFQDLIQEIQRGKAYRIKLIDREFAMEAEQANIKNIASSLNLPLDYKEEFSNAYKKRFNEEGFLPNSYINDTITNMLEHKSEEWIKKYTDYLNGKGNTPPFDIMNDLINDKTLLYNPKHVRSLRAFEFAAAQELYAKTNDPNFYNVDAVNLETYLRKECLKEIQNNVKQKNRTNTERIEKSYNDYKNDLPENELKSYVLNFFVPKSQKNTDIQGLTNYLRTFGKGLAILFSEQSKHPLSVKCIVKDKILYYMPDNIKDKYIFLLDSDDRIEDEKLIKQIDRELSERFSFINKNFVEKYLNKINNICRYYERKNNEVSAVYRPESYLRFMGKKRDTLYGELTNLPIPRDRLPKEDKYEFLAMEQAMADILFEASKDETVYKLSFETMCDLFEQAEILRKHPKSDKKLIISDMFNEIHNKELILKKIPNRFKINQKYYEYCEDFKEVEQQAKNENRDIDKEDLLCWLNPVEGNNLRDDNVLKKITFYFTDNN